MKESFIKFLEDNNALDLFKANLSKIDRDFDFYINQKYRMPSLIIDTAFTWSETPQGRQFWCDLDREWRNFLQTKF